MAKQIWQGCALALLFGSSSAFALEWGVDGRVGAQHETNPDLSFQDEQADWRRIAEVRGFLSHESSQIDVDLDYSAYHESWADKTFDDRNTFTGFGSFQWQPANFFRFFLENRRRDLIVNNQDADTPDNRDVRTTLTGGVEFIANVTSVDELYLQGVYRKVGFQESFGIDQNRPGVGVGWRHRLSEVSRLSVDAFAERIEFKDQDTIERGDVDRANLYAEYQAQLRRIDYVIQVGYTWVDADETIRIVDDGSGPTLEVLEAQKFGEPLIRADLGYTKDNHRLTFTAFHVLTDTSIGLDENNIGGIDYTPEDSNFDQLDLVTRQQVRFGYNLLFGKERWTLDVVARGDREDYQTAQRDQDRQRINTLLTYQINRRIDLGMYADYERIHFQDDPNNTRYNTLWAGVRMGFRIFRFGEINLRLERQRRTSGDDFAEFTNNVAAAEIRLFYP